MKKKLLGIALPFLAFTTAIPFGITTQDQVNVNSQQIKSENPNNHYMVDYSDADSSSGFSSEVYVELRENSLYDDALYYYNGSRLSSFTFRLNDGYEFADFDSAIETTYFTLYDVTNGEFEPIGVLPLNKGDDGFRTMAVTYPTVGTYNQAATVYVNKPMSDISDYGNVSLEEYHQYRIGFNINQGDDFEEYSGIFELETPKIVTFNVVSTDNSFTIDYALSTPSTSNIEFVYNDLYIKVNDQKYTLDNPVGQIVIDDLKPATEYQIDFGYDATKIVSTQSSFPESKEISDEESFSFSTNVPNEYELTSTIAVSLVLLIILIIIFLFLIMIIVYWNHQRRKVSELSLVFGEDTEAYDPVYNHNYYQEENYDSPNTSNDDIYYEENRDIDHYNNDYYDDNNYDNDYYANENGIDDYENAHEDFDEMEEWK